MAGNFNFETSFRPAAKQPIYEKKNKSQKKRSNGKSAEKAHRSGLRVVSGDGVVYVDENAGFLLDIKMK